MAANSFNAELNADNVAKVIFHNQMDNEYGKRVRYKVTSKGGLNITASRQQWINAGVSPNEFDQYPNGLNRMNISISKPMARKANIIINEMIASSRKAMDIVIESIEDNLRIAKKDRDNIHPYKYFRIEGL
ncbi:TPA: hypothetical protein MBH56_005496 [Klebsiella pneumoniae]|nr:hypothetical protein [Klebsiella pneumoniae]